jgi:SDR family mycofactocin-dependent oxidoreductase
VNRMQDKVVCITGAARNQGRSHAVRLAEEGADVIALDICRGLDTVDMYPACTPEDLEETAHLVRGLGRKVVTRIVDVRDAAALDAAMSEGAAELGRLDVVVANAGIFSRSTAVDMEPEVWQEMIDVNLTGAWHTAASGIRLMREHGNGGSLVIISSGAGFKGAANAVHYTAAKHAVVGLARALAVEAAPDGIRVNTLHPTNVATTMIQNEATYQLFRPDLEQPTMQDALDGFASINLLPLPWIEPRDVSNALLWLVSDEARYVTGSALPVDAGLSVK